MTRHRTSRRLLLSAVALVLALTGPLMTPAMAQEAPGAVLPGQTESLTPVPAPPMRVERYGLTVMLMDLGWMTLAGTLKQPTLYTLGYLGVAPLTHMIKGNDTGAMRSLGVRVLLPIGGMMGGYMLAREDCEDCELVGALLGGAVGVGTAMVVDWVWLAKKQTPVRAAGGFYASPRLVLTQDQVSLGVVGVF